ncbi:lysylphosphatidylglycerol synthase transmembrane domain-containing protein [Actinoplanes utahensis]|uniref:lysylphosphatidylglycerol synthase transmembrane domain-containing protein n=1 Tax=Actinoplanes utahensis TaxID=1869 RepID=UPI0013779A73|nr:lysylphosphatidylglycerol synthase transmembrane domain-containing protein [Actinoplanes utahensis]
MDARAKRRKWLRGVVLVASLVGAAVLVRRQFPDPVSVLGLMRAVDPGWASLAVLAGLISQLSFALQQHGLLRGFGVPIGRADTVALTSAGNAVSAVAPAGAVVSAAYTFRQYVARGATPAAAAAVTVLSGVVSALALVTLAAGGFLAAAPALLWVPVTALAVMVPLARARPALSFDRARIKRRLARWPRVARFAASLARMVTMGRGVPGRDWATVFAFAAGKWVFDLACLMLIAAAFGAELRWEHLAGVYLSVQVIRQIPLTPGGIGVIEASLLAGLVTAGAPAALAVGIVLGYRLVSFWSMLPVGLAGYLYLRAGERAAGRKDPLSVR